MFSVLNEKECNNEADINMLFITVTSYLVNSYSHLFVSFVSSYFQSVLKLTLFTAPLQGPLHCPVFDLSRRRRGKHGSQSRRQPWQPHDSGNGVLSEEPQEDHVLPGIEEQALPALRHLPSQRNLRQAGQHVCKIQRLTLITFPIILTVKMYRVCYNVTEALPDRGFYFNVGFIIIVIFLFCEQIYGVGPHRQ